MRSLKIVKQFCSNIQKNSTLKETSNSGYELVVEQKERKFMKACVGGITSFLLYSQFMDPTIPIIIGAYSLYNASKFPMTFERLYYNKSEKKMIFEEYKNFRLVNQEFSFNEVTSLNVLQEINMIDCRFNTLNHLYMYHIKTNVPEYVDSVKSFQEDLESYIIEKINQKTKQSESEQQENKNKTQQQDKNSK